MASIKKLQLRAAAWGIGAHREEQPIHLLLVSPHGIGWREPSGLSVALLCDLGQTVTLSGNLLGRKAGAEATGKGRG